MTNNYFLNNIVGDTKAISVKATALIKVPVEMTGDPRLNFELMDGNLKPVAQDMVDNVLDVNSVYNITHADARLSGAVSEVLFSMLMKEAERSGIELQEVSAVAETVQEPKTLEELVEMYNIEEVVIEGVNITEKKVIAMMGAAGLHIGGRCESKIGPATILGFHAGINGVLVVVVIDGEDVPRKLMADKVKTLAPVAATRSEDDVLISSEIAKLMGSVGGVEIASRAAVSDAIFAGGMTIRTVEDEITEAERFELAEEERIAGRQKWIDDRKANAVAVSGSEAAQRILAMANKQLEGGEAPQKEQVKNDGKSTRRPSAQQQTTNQTNGGNVQMTTQTQGTQVDAPKQSVAGNKAPRRTQGTSTAPKATTTLKVPAATNTGKSQRRPAAGAAPKTTVKVPVGNNAGTTTRRPAGGTTRLGAGAPIASNTSVAVRNTGVVGLRMDTPVARTGRDGKWFEDATRLPAVISGADFEATRQNLELGITGAKFFEAAAYAEWKGFTARETDLATIVLEFGPELTFEFQIKISSNPEAKQPWYCSNVSFIKSRSGNGGYWTYVVGRRKDDAVLIEEKNGDLRMANYKEIEANPANMLTIKGAGWVNDSIYGMRMGEQVIAQVMRFADYAWSALFVEEVAAE